MGNLIKPSDYASKMGISRQAVYAKIKKGILPSRNIGGKIFIVLDKEIKSNSPKRSLSDSNSTAESKDTESNEKLLKAKDETISILRETIADLKETNKMITSTLRGEVELLKEAFSEMKMLYSLQLEHKKQESDSSKELEIDDADIQEDGQIDWIELNDFFALNGIKKEKKQKKIKKQLKKLFKKGDSRIESFNGELVFMADADFADIIESALG